MNTIKNKINSTIIFNLGYIFLIVSDMCKQIDFIRIYDKHISFAGYLFIAIYLFVNVKKFLKMNKKHLLLIIFGCLVLLVGFYFSRNFTIIRLLMLLLSIMLMDFDRFVKKDALYKGIIIVVLISAALLGFIDNKMILRSDWTKRYSLGFTHPNVLSLYLTFLTFEVTYLLLKNREKITWFRRSIVSLIIPAMIVFSNTITDSKSSVIALFAFYIFIVGYLFFYDYLAKLLSNKIIKNLIVRVFLITSLVFFATLVAAHYKPNILSKLDQIFSNRYSYYFTFLKRVDFNGLGRVIPVSIDKAFLDNMYLKIVLNGGVIFYMVYYLIFTFSAKKTYKTNNYILLIILSIMCFIGFVETNVLMPTLNIFILYFASAHLLNDSKEKVHKNEGIN